MGFYLVSVAASLVAGALAGYGWARMKSVEQEAESFVRDVTSEHVVSRLDEILSAKDLSKEDKLRRSIEVVKGAKKNG